jgi:hypothetical protein
MSVVGKYTTYDSPFLDTQVKGLAALVDPKLTTTWDLLPELDPIRTEKIKWYDAESATVEGEVVGAGWTGAATTGLGIDSVLATLINVGDVLRVQDEYVVVKAVDRTAEEIDVYGLGFGGTTPAAHAATTPIYIVGNANVEGTVDGDSIVEDNILRENYSQLIEEPVELSVTASLQLYEDVEAKMDEMREKAMRRALIKMNKTALFGVADAGSKTTPRGAGGLRYFISGDVNAVNVDATAGGGSFDESVLQTALLEVAKRGGSPDLIICSPTVKQIINGFNKVGSNPTIFVGQESREAGVLVDFYNGEGVGRLAVISDPILNDAFGELYIVNSRKLGKAWFAQDELRFVSEPSNSRTIKETLQGQFSLLVKDIRTDHARIYNI